MLICWSDDLDFIIPTYVLSYLNPFVTVCSDSFTMLLNTYYNLVSHAFIDPIFLVLIFYRCHEIDNRLIKLVWDHRPTTLFSNPPSVLSAPSGALSPFDTESRFHLTEKDPHRRSDGANVEVKEVEGGMNKRTTREMKEEKKKGKAKKSWFSWKSQKNIGKDIEGDIPSQRPTKLLGPIYNGISAGLCFCNLLISPPIWTLTDPMDHCRLYGQWCPDASS